jgi:hypothetical protein
MKEYKSIEVMNTNRKQIRQDTKSDSRIEMSNPKDSGNPGNSRYRFL